MWLYFVEILYCAVNRGEDVDGLADEVVPGVAVERVEQTLTYSHA